MNANPQAETTPLTARDQKRKRFSLVRSPGEPDPVYLARHAYQSLYFAFIAIPLIAGIDKFTNVLVDWTSYLAPVFPNTLGVFPSDFMRGVGVIEMIAGIGVAVWPRVFANVVAAWLGGIIVNLLVLGNHYDVAARDFGLLLAAFALGRLAEARARKVEVFE